MSTVLAQVIRQNQASGAYQRWQPTTFDAPAAAVVVAPTPEPEPDLAQTDATLEIAPGVTLPTAEDIERIHQEAYKEGYTAGYEEGSARGRIEAAQLHQLLQAMDEALGNLDQEVAEEVQALALEVARQVVRDSIAAQPESLLTVIREALAQVPQVEATIRVHPADAQLVRQYLAEQAHGLSHRLAEDENIERGGAIIESSGGQIDAQITTRWRRVVETLSRSAAHYGD